MTQQPRSSTRRRTVGRSKMMASKRTASSVKTRRSRTRRAHSTRRQMTPATREKYWNIRDTAEPLILTNVAVPPHIKERLRIAMQSVSATARHAASAGTVAAAALGR